LKDQMSAHAKLKESVESRLKSLEDLIGSNADKYAKGLDGAMSKLAELASLKDRMNTLEKLSGDAANAKELKDHLESVEDRLKYLEKFIGDSANAKDLKDHKAAFGSHKESMEIRLKFIEDLIGDNADKHWKEIDAAKNKLGDLDKAIAASAKHDHLASIEERTTYLENFIGESADKHAKDLKDLKDQHKAALGEHKESMETRLKFLEDLIGDNADKHAKEINVAKNKLGDLDKAIAALAKHDHVASVEDRVDSLEKELDAARKKQEATDTRLKFLEEHKKDLKDHKESMETRLKFIEDLIGDNADKHSKEIDAAKSKLGDLDKAIAACAKQEHHSSLEERVNYLESFIGESADKHAKALKDLQDHKATFVEHKETMETRLEYLEALIGDNADKHWKEIEAAKNKLGDLDKAIAASAKHDHLQSIEERMNFLEKFIGEAANAKELKGHRAAFGEHKESMETRLKFLEDLIGDTADKHWKEIDAANKRLGDVDKAIAASAKHDHLQSMEERMSYLEKFVGDTADKNDKALKENQKELKDHKAKFSVVDIAIAACTKDDQHAALVARVINLEKSVERDDKLIKDDQKDLKDLKAAMEQRLDNLDASMGDSATGIGAVKNRFADLEKAIAACAKSEQLVKSDERVKQLGKAMDEAAAKQQQEMKELRDFAKTLEKTLKEHQQYLKDHDARVEYLEKFVGESADKHSKELKELGKDLKSLKSSHAEHKESMETRLKFLEDLVGDNADNHAKEIDAAKKRLADFDKAIAVCAKQEHHASLQERVNYLENAVDKQSKELKEDLKDLKGHKDKYQENKASVETRLEYAEGMIGSSADKQTKELHATNSRLADLQKAVALCAKTEQFSSWEIRLNYLEKFVGDSADKDKDKQINVNLRECMEYFFGVARTDITVRLNELAKLDDPYGMNESLPKAVEDLHKQMEHLELMINDLKQGRIEHAIVPAVESPRPRLRSSSLVPRKASAISTELIQREVIEVVQVPVPQMQQIQQFQ